MQISINKSDNVISLDSPWGDAKITLDKKVDEIADLNDFAVWIFLPLAMGTGHDLNICGKGTATTIENAHELTRIWQTWMPAHYSSITIDFEHVVANDPINNEVSKNLLLYTTGIDSTYSAHQNFDHKDQLDLLTVKQSEYGIARQKGERFAEEYANDRLIAESNVRYLYEENEVTSEWSGMLTFELAGILFLHSSYSDYYIGSDFTSFQLPAVYPYVNSEISNSRIDNGYRQLTTTNTETLRSSKAKYIYENNLEDYLNFCDNAKPDNCGKCSKCMRTKLMFKVTTGDIPDIFQYPDLPEDWIETMNTRSRYERAYLNDILIKAKENDDVNIPNLEQAESKITRDWLLQHPSESPNNHLQEIYKRIPHPLKFISKKLYEQYQSFRVKFKN